MIYISPSILASDFANLEQEALGMKAACADMLHIDVMDGCFVPNISIGPCVISSLRKKSDLFFDVHLMIQNPLKYIGDFANAGADMITFHVESDSDVAETIKAIKSLGKKAGIALKPKTDANVIEKYINDVDMVLVMTVEPGFGGQKFMADMMPKVKTVRDMCNACGREDMLIQVDGGIDNSTAPVVAENGANVLVAGSALFSKNDYKEAVAQLRSAAESAAV